MRKISIGDVVMSGGGRVDGWYFNSMKGWFGFEDVSQESDDIEGGNGSFYAQETYLPSAVISISGVYAGETPTDASIARRQLSALRNRGRETEMFFDDDEMETSRSVFVRRVVPDNNRHSSFSFEMDLVSYDPFRYGPEVTETTLMSVPGEGGLSYPVGYPIDYGRADSRGRVYIMNDGSEISSPKFVIAGGFLENGVRLRRGEDGTSIWFRRTLNLSDELTLDPELQTATVNGIDNSIYLTVEKWPEVGPGESATVQFMPLGNTSGSPTLTSKIRPAYL